MDDISTAELIEELKHRAEAYRLQRSALGAPAIEFWFLPDEWNFDDDEIRTSLRL